MTLETSTWSSIINALIRALVGLRGIKFEPQKSQYFVPYTGTWYGYWLDPTDRKLIEEIWKFTRWGTVTMGCFNDQKPIEMKVQAKGKLSVKGKKAYLALDKIEVDERFYVLFDLPRDRTGNETLLMCVWLADYNGTTTAGCGLLSRTKLTNANSLFKAEYLTAR